MNDNTRLLVAIVLCFFLIVAFGFIFSGLLGAFIGGFIAGLITKGMTKGVVAGFIGGIFATTLLTTLALVGFIFFDEIIIGKLLWDSLDHSVVGIAILLEFLAILLSAIGGLVGGFLLKIRRR